MFREAGVPAERRLTEPRDGNRGDLVLPPDVPLVVQARVGPAPSPWRALADAAEAAGPGEVPVGAVRRNGRGGRPAEDLAVLPLGAFVQLVGALRAAGWPEREPGAEGEPESPALEALARPVDVEDPGEDPEGPRARPRPS